MMRKEKDGSPFQNSQKSFNQKSNQSVPDSPVAVREMREKAMLRNSREMTAELFAKVDESRTLEPSALNTDDYEHNTDFYLVNKKGKKGNI